MDDLADANQVLMALRRAVMLGVDLADAADIYAWGLTREFGAVRTAVLRDAVEDPCLLPSNGLVEMLWPRSTHPHPSHRSRPNRTHV